MKQRSARQSARCASGTAGPSPAPMTWLVPGSRTTCRWAAPTSMKRSFDGAMPSGRHTFNRLNRDRLQVEHLDRDVVVGVDAAVEGADLAVEDPLDGPDELLLGRVLEVEPRIAKALVLLHLRQPPLGRGEAVFQRADDDVQAGELGLRLGRAAAELLLVEPNHLSGYFRGRRMPGGPWPPYMEEEPVRPGKHVALRWRRAGEDFHRSAATSTHVQGSSSCHRSLKNLSWIRGSDGSASVPARRIIPLRADRCDPDAGDCGVPPSKGRCRLCHLLQRCPDHQLQ